MVIIIREMYGQYLYWIWKWQNKLVHDGNYKSMWKPQCFILDQVKSYHNLKDIQRMSSSTSKQTINVCQSSSMHVCICLNTNNAAKMDRQLAGFVVLSVIRMVGGLLNLLFIWVIPRHILQNSRVFMKVYAQLEDLV